MKCKYCDGTGEHINDANRMTTCEFCGGTGVIKPLTNEEWRRTCSAEEFADWIVNVLFSEDFKKHIHYMGYANMHSYKTEVLEWLKEKHNG